jgi:phage repressor protein C with HTH and peptisase S24 domain
MAAIPVVGKVSAGPGETNVDPDTERTIFVPLTLAQLGGLGWVVDGESMMPALEPGDIAVFREYRSPRRGYPMLLCRDGEYRVKNIEWENEWIQRSINPAIPDEPLGHWQILGYLIGWHRSRGSYEKLESDPNGLRLM